MADIPVVDAPDSGPLPPLWHERSGSGPPRHGIIWQASRTLNEKKEGIL